jgi:hypothetical protein
LRGPGGYAELQEALVDKNPVSHKLYTDWREDNSDPEDFGSEPLQMRVANRARNEAQKPTAGQWQIRSTARAQPKITLKRK